MEGQTEDKTPKSKFTAQQCPVCNGFGTLKYGSKTCQACKGRGFIVINNKTGFPVEEDGNGRMDKALQKS